jgi:thioredoxin reductase
MTTTKTDLLIIGGGPAGLSTATFFARVNRPFVLYDSQLYRNAQSPVAHTIMGFEGVNPPEYRSKVRAEIEVLYGKGPGGLGNGVFRNGKIVSLEKVDGGFEAVDKDGGKVMARKVVLATGMSDVLPDIPGEPHQCLVVDR